MSRLMNEYGMILVLLLLVVSFSALTVTASHNSGAAAGSLEGRALLFGATEHKAVPEALRHWNQILGLGAEVVAVAPEEEVVATAIAQVAPFAEKAHPAMRELKRGLYPSVLEALERSRVG